MEGVPIEPHSLAYVREMAAIANEYVNTATSDRNAKVRSKEAIAQLNSAIEDVYLHKPVTVYGLHQKAAYAPKDGSYHVYLKDGAVSGISDGFVVVDAMKDFQTIEEKQSPRQRNLLEQVKNLSFGRYMLSHLITLEDRVFVRNDFLMQTNVRARAFAPAAISEIFLDEQSDIPEDSRTLEAERIVTSADPLTAKLVESLLRNVEETDDVITTLVQSARTFRQIHGLNAVASKAALHLLEESVGDSLFGQTYHFEDSLLIMEETGSIIEFNKLLGPDIRMLITSFATGPHADVQSHRFQDETSLYLGACRMNGNVVITNPIYLPLEHLDPSKIKPLGPLSQVLSP